MIDRVKEILFRKVRLGKIIFGIELKYLEAHLENVTFFADQ